MNDREDLRMNDETWEQHRSTFDTRGVSREVADQRPYIRYEKGERKVVDELFASIPPSQRGATIIRRVNYSGGWLMPRHRVDRSLRHVLPEFGPADELEPRLERHRHTWPPRWVDHIMSHSRHAGENVDGAHEHPEVVCGPPRTCEHKALETHRHDSVDPKVWADHVGGKRSAREHEGVGPDDLHAHDKAAKYLFAPKPWQWAPMFRVKHDHGARSAGKWHPEGDTDAPHQHIRWEKAPESYARRLDVHPDTWAILPDARRVFWSIEGVLKNDALVSAGEAVFNVPSVWQWDAPELEAFARSYLRDKHVFIVPDSDWAENPEVSLAAFAARAALQRVLGKRWVHVAAPTPELADCALHADKDGVPAPAGSKRGVDDYLADGCPVDGLEVLERETSRGMREWCRWYAGWFYPGTNERGRRSAAAIVEALAIVADEHGRVARRERAIATYMGWSGSRAYERVRRGIESLVEIDAPDWSPFEYVQAASSDWALIGVNWRGQWEAAPVIVLREDIRAARRRTVPVGEVSR